MAVRTVQVISHKRKILKCRKVCQKRNVKFPSHTRFIMYEGGKRVKLPEGMRKKYIRKT